jgi:hypothetical protein
MQKQARPTCCHSEATFCDWMKLSTQDLPDYHHRRLQNLSKYRLAVGTMGGPQRPNPPPCFGGENSQPRSPKCSPATAADCTPVRAYRKPPRPPPRPSCHFMRQSKCQRLPSLGSHPSVWCIFIFSVARGHNHDPMATRSQRWWQ